MRLLARYLLGTKQVKLSVFITASLLVCISLPASVFGKSSQPPDSSLLSRTPDAIKHEDSQRKYQTYLEKARIYVRDHEPPHTSREYFRLAFCQDSLGDSKSAIANYSNAIALNPNMGAAYNNRGLLLSALRDHKGALSDFTKANNLHPSGHYHLNLFYEKESLHDYKGAIGELEKLMGQTAHPEFCLRLSAPLRACTADIDGAIEDYGKLIAIKPDFSWFAKRGDLYLRQGKLKEALADFDQALQEENGQAKFFWPDTYRQRAYVRVRIGDVQGAMKDIWHSDGLALAQQVARKFSPGG